MLVYGSGNIAVYWVRTDKPEFLFVPAMCPMERLFVWDFEDHLYLIPAEIIKNAQRVYKTRQAHNDVYADKAAAEPVKILLEQAIPWLSKASYLKVTQTIQP